MRQGNFSEINRPIYDPLTGAALPGEHHSRRTAAIPRRRTSCSDLLPDAEHGRDAQRARPEHQQLPDQPPLTAREDNQFDVKIDHNLSANNRFFVRYS